MGHMDSTTHRGTSTGPAGLEKITVEKNPGHQEDP